MLFQNILIGLSLTIAATAAPSAKSGSQLFSYALSDCTVELGIVRDLPNDGVQGTPCQTFKALYRTDDTRYRNLAQSVKTINIQSGCTAYVYSGPYCPDNQVTLKVDGLTSGEQCHELEDLAESVKVVCH
ncbi:uncharacterized protein FA14DRAFT_158768 [Meira miltonrushii]|uniref:Uncharacterized protein n=1 Tax=Meira miltonrushii TaxID=1280837 RepID=A0A316V328_9BASI|nr:uncharacterized protein FA14DRAFT_158768 [Meira miltonrushii]PWN31398.1 hypothetical protein FA14DRAFT_158768 [Meira miltonrushii]